MDKYRLLNSRIPRLDAYEKVTGRATYTDDLVMPDMLYAAIYHSPLAHAKILNIDPDLAKAHRGVVEILTAKNLKSRRFGVNPACYDESILAEDKVRYVGDEIVAVAAKTPEAAWAGVGLIDVDFEELLTVLDGLKAMQEEAPQIHAKYPRNICSEVHWHFGDVEKARSQADYIRTDQLTSKMQDAAFIEPQAMLAYVDNRGYLTLHTSTQAPHYVQRTIAMVLDYPLHKVRVVKPYVGGGFGPKAACSSAELITCVLAINTGKPVKLTFDREQVFLHSRARHQFYHTMTTGVKKDGTLLFLDHHCVLDGGAYSSFGIVTAHYAGALLAGPYKLDNMRYDGYRVITNKPACGAQRGHGAVIARAAFETQLDRISEEIGMDPIELRLKNVLKAGNVTCNEFNVSSLGMKECLEAIREKSAWEEKRKKKKKLGKGIGVACGFFVSGAGYPVYRSDTPHCNVIIKAAEVGGGVTVLSGAADIGQGSDTVIAMITAEVLGIPINDVKVKTGDSDLSLDLGAYSSRTTLMTGHATKEAAESVKRQILEVLSEKLEIPVENLEFQDGYLQIDKKGLNERDLEDKIKSIHKAYVKEHVGFKGLPREGPITFAEASRLAFLERGTIIGTGSYKPPELGGDFKGAKVGTSPAYGCSAQIAEVTVDLETGQVTVDKIIGAHDCGFAINPTMVEGQMQGAMMMGLGEALMEEIIYDEQGRIVNANLAEYKIPTALDMPPIETIIVESHEPNGPFGAKEVGEGAIMPTIPAILNAIYDATGVRIEELPAKPERIVNLLKNKKE